MGPWAGPGPGLGLNLGAKPGPGPKLLIGKKKYNVLIGRKKRAGVSFSKYWYSNKNQAKITFFYLIALIFFLSNFFHEIFFLRTGFSKKTKKNLSKKKKSAEKLK